MKPWRPVTQLCAIIAVPLAVIIPVIVASYFYFMRNQLNLPLYIHGFLLKDPVKVSQTTLLDLSNHKIKISDYQGRWVLMYIFSHCDYQHSLGLLKKMAQLNLALGGFSRKMHMMPVYKSGCHIPTKFIDKISTYQSVGQQLLRISPKQLTTFNAYFNGYQLQGRVVGQNRLYVIDPKGYVIIYYVDSISLKDEYQDLSYLFINNPAV